MYGGPFIFQNIHSPLHKFIDIIIFDIQTHLIQLIVSPRKFSLHFSIGKIFASFEDILRYFFSSCSLGEMLTNSKERVNTKGKEKKNSLELIIGKHYII